MTELNAENDKFLFFVLICFFLIFQIIQQITLI